MILLAVLLTACGQGELLTTVRIPESLTQDVPYPSLEGRTTDADIANLLIDYEQSIDQANGQLAGIREILSN